MLKILYEEGFLNIEKILLQEYKNIDLELKELMLLFFLFQDYHDKIFSSLHLANKTNLSKNEVEVILESLLKKQFFSLAQEERKNKIVEIFDLDNTFIKLEKLFLKRKKEKQEREQRHYISETIESLEKLKGTVLTVYELEIVKNWYLENNFNHKDIMKVIDYANTNQKKSIYYVERMLNYEYNLKNENDEKTDKILHEIFKKMK
ncbi:MAG: DnaD domain protein [Vigna little leaf phytoplasma]|nr:DnaD domain protein [Vigna little leaf phytoplasma]MDV3198159.1 DnaD domain protein [Vigna little leaf phytoplasma]